MWKDGCFSLVINNAEKKWFFFFASKWLMIHPSGTSCCDESDGIKPGMWTSARVRVRDHFSGSVIIVTLLMRRLGLVWSDHVTQWLLPPCRGPLNTQPGPGIFAVLFLGIGRADHPFLPVSLTGHFKLIPPNFTGILHNFWHFSSQSQLCLLNPTLILKLLYIRLMCDKKKNN